MISIGKYKLTPLILVTGLVLLRIITHWMPVRSYSGVYCHKAENYLNSGQDKLAIWAYQRAIFHNPHDPRAFVGLGRIYAAQGDRPKQQIYFAKAAQAGTDDPDVLYAEGVRLKEIGQWDGAQTCFERVIKFNIHHARAFYQLGELYRLRGLPEKAKENYQKAIDRDFVYNQARFQLGSLQIHTGDIHGALDQAQNIESHGQDPALAEKLRGAIKDPSR